MLFAGGLGAVLVVLIGASALTGRHSGEVPVVSADPRPIREKPANPGGMKVDGAENDVFSGGSDTSNAKLAPAPEAPNTKALRTQAAPLVADEAPAPAAPAPAAPPASAAPAPAPVTKPTVTATTPAKPAVTAIAPAKPTTAATVPAKPAAAKSQAAAEEAHPAAAGHVPMVQLAALPSEEAAHAEWNLLVKKMPELLNGKQPSYARIERDGRAFWRVRTAGFADIAQARSFCDRVRAKGGGCSIADF